MSKFDLNKANPEQIIEKFSGHIRYSRKYEDTLFQYRNVTLPSELYYIKKTHFSDPDKLLTEKEWRWLKVQGGPGWEHYSNYKPEPHILLFRRPLNVARQYDKPQNAIQEEISELEKEQQNIQLQLHPTIV